MGVGGQERWRLGEQEPRLMRTLSSSPSAFSLQGGHAGGRAPAALLKVGSSSGSFPFSRCLHSSRDQHSGQSWDPPVLGMSSSRFGDHCGLTTPSVLNPAPGFGDPFPQKDDCCSKASHKGNTGASLPPCHRNLSSAAAKASFCTKLRLF